MALFGRKKDGADQRPHDTGSPHGDEGAKGKGRKSEDSAVGVSISPDKARRFWEHARTADQTANYEYALQLWLRGLRFDPTDMTALESFVRSALEFNQSKNGKKGPSRETIREFSGRDGVNPYLSALLTWATKPRDTAAIVRAAKAGAKLKIDEPTFWLAERAQTILRAESKPRKSLCTQLMAVFAELDAFEKAVQCGEMAVLLDPTDGQLAASVKNLAAQAAMASGGYDEAGQEGGFRRNIRDLDRQRQLEDEDRIVKTDETIERMIKKVEHNLKLNPDDMPSLLKLVDLLKQRMAAGDEKRAFDLLNQAHARTKEFRFRQGAGEIKIRAARRKLVAKKETADAAPDDQQAQHAYKALADEFVTLEIAEYRLRIENYPTDLKLKFGLGKLFFAQGEHEDAIAMFQESQNESRHRVASRSFLGRSFLAIGWIDEAVQTLRDAMDVHKVHSDDTGLELRYFLLTALQMKAEQDRDLAAAEEADKLSSAIAIQQISYRDIRDRRDAIKTLILSLRQDDRR